MLIRPFLPEDAPALAALFHAAVREIGRQDYSESQVCAWSPGPPDPDRYIGRAADGRLFLVAVDEKDRPIAYGDPEPSGHIDHLYCHPDVAGTGVAAVLYDRLEKYAAENDILFLCVEASEAARRFFERKGFIVEERRDFAIKGVMIHNFRMTKRLC